jgi:copper homeostasis protein (lipoprotein)
MTNKVWPILLASLLAAGCHRNQDEAAANSQSPVAPQGAAIESAQNSERTWVGLLPCSDCEGIDTRLVLRADGGRRNYLMTETYVGGSGKNSFNRAGSWTEVTRLVDGEPVTTFTLDPDKAGQQFTLQPDGALEALDGSGKLPTQAVAYRLQRQ